MDRKYKISVVIPVFISRCIDESIFYFSNNPSISDFELIFVADSSGDKTISIIRKRTFSDRRIRLIVNNDRLEKGFSVKEGMLSAKYDLMLFYDADLSVPLTEIGNFLAKISRHDILIASRGLPDSRVQKKFLKILLSRLFSAVKLVMLGVNYHDTQCGFKMFRKKTLVLFRQQRIKSSCFDVELLYNAGLHNFSVKELPVTWIDSDRSNFNTLKVIGRFIVDIMRIRYYSWSGKYGPAAGKAK